MSHARLTLRIAFVTVLAACAAVDEGVPAQDDSEPAAAEPRGSKITLSSGEIDTALAAKAEPGEGERAIVKFPGPPTRAQLEELEAQTERIYAYLPDDAFLVKAAAGRRLAPAELGASWSGRFAPEYKLGRGVQGYRGSDPQIVMVQVFPDGDLARVGAELPAGRVVGRQMGARFGRVRLILPADEIAATTRALAAQPDVFFVDIEARRTLYNDTTDWVVQSGLDGGQSTPVWDHGILGEGQVVGILDSGVDIDMCYFSDARGLPPQNLCNFGTLVDNNQRKVIAVDFTWDKECAGGISTREWDTHGHGTHVAGTVAGDDKAHPLAHDSGDGVAPGAKLVIQDCGGPEEDDCADCSGIGCPVVDLNPFFKQAYDQGARIHTNSWGDQENAFVQNNYTAASQDSDEFMWEHKDFLIVYAAGNSGPGPKSVGSPSTAKSVLSVGATRRGTSADSMATFSSCGPTDDGRIKPELTMPGQGIISASSDFDIGTNNCGRESMSGTSMAAPGAAGAAALVRQYFTDGYYPTGVAVAGNKMTPSGALMRAILVSSGRNMPSAASIPGGCQGWGRVTLDDALFFAGEARKLAVRDDQGFAQGAAGETRTFSYDVRAGQPLKVTLAWTDYPSTPAASPHIVNDLDLEVSGPGGTFRGNVFASGVSAAAGSADRKNTLEEVLLASPAAGTYTVTVRAFTVPRGPQPFALVVTGDLTAGDAGALHASAGADHGGTVAQVVTIDGSGSTASAGGTLGYSWTQTAGPAVTLTGALQPVAGFTPTRAGTYTFELTVSDGAGSDKDSVTITVGGSDAAVLFEDDFEGDKGWTMNPAGDDSATSGRFERGNPSNTSYQAGRTVSGFQDLVTGKFQNGAAAANDVDGGKTSASSAAIAVPAGATLAFSYYLAHSDNSTTVDYLRVKVVGATTQVVLEERGAATRQPAVWRRFAVNLDAFAGQTVKIVVEASDGGKSSLVEAAVDDVILLKR